MSKPKIHPLILIALLINAISMGMFAYRNFNEEQPGSAIIFIILCLLLLGLAAYGWMENRRQKNDADKELKSSGF